MAKRITYKKLSETALRKITEDPTDVWNYTVGGNRRSIQVILGDAQEKHETAILGIGPKDHAQYPSSEISEFPTAQRHVLSNAINPA